MVTRVRARDEAGACRLRPGVRRRGSLLWSLAALAVAAGLAPGLVLACHSLHRLSARNVRRLAAVQAGLAELRRIRREGPGAAGSYPLSQLPGGFATVEVSPGPAAELRRVTLTLTWREGTRSARAGWTTLAPAVAGETAP